MLHAAISLTVSDLDVCPFDVVFFFDRVKGTSDREPGNFSLDLFGMMQKDSSMKKKEIKVRSTCHQTFIALCCRSSLMRSSRLTYFSRLFVA